jgi:hypothetical protein
MGKIANVFKSYLKRLKAEVNREVIVTKNYKSAIFLTCLTPALITYATLKFMEAPLKYNFSICVLIFVTLLISIYTAFKNKETKKLD